MSLTLPATNPRFTDLDTFEADAVANAAAILESNELLTWISTRRCETVAQTRRHYERILCGIDSDEEPVEWEESTTPTEDDFARLRVGKEWCAGDVRVKKEPGTGSASASASAKGKGKGKLEDVGGSDVDMRDVGVSDVEGVKGMEKGDKAKRRSGGMAGPSSTSTASSSARRSDARSQGSPYKSKKRRSGHGTVGSSSRG